MGWPHYREGCEQRDRLPVAFENQTHNIEENNPWEEGLEELHVVVTHPLSLERSQYVQEGTPFTGTHS